MTFMVDMIRGKSRKKVKDEEEETVESRTHLNTF